MALRARPERSRRDAADGGCRARRNDKESAQRGGPCNYIVQVSIIEPALFARLSAKNLNYFLSGLAERAKTKA